MSLKQQASAGAEVNESMAALVNNANAVRAIAAAVEGTLGPRGLDTMLVDKFGEVVITNDGVTILTMMEANHPAARMVINIARAQQEEVGDGTTTATVMAGAMVAAGVEQVARGVPVSRVIEGLKAGVQEALQYIGRKARPLVEMEDPALWQVALIAGREHRDIAELVVQAARLVGREKLLERGYKFADNITARAGAENQVLTGIIIDKEPVNRQMPREVEDCRILVIDDALQPEEIEEEALATEAGFARYMELLQQHRSAVQKIIDLGVGLVLVDRGIDDTAEEMLTDAGIMVVQRVAARELRRAAEHTGARMIKRTGLKKDVDVLRSWLGRARRVYHDEKLAQVWIVEGNGKPTATVVVGAATAEVVGERERIARDAASAVQAAVRGGIVPGGGAIELAASRQVEKMRARLKGMAAYGVDCVVEALRRPLAQIVANAGFNPLEKMGDVLSAQAERDSDSLAIDCDSGQVADMLSLGVLDPAPVKLHALRAAGEIAGAILRIDTIIKKREDKPAQHKEG